MRYSRCGTRSSVEALLTPGARGWVGWVGWVGLAAGYGVAALALFGVAPTALDWQPALAWREPWRAFSAIAVHYSALHLAANLAGLTLVGALGVAARVPGTSVAAWAVAWPLTQLGLLARPDLAHYGGLSGVLHGGAAVVAVHLICSVPSARRLIGAALLAGITLKVLGEAPWGPALRHPAGWDIATAPIAHATGLVAGVACALAAAVLRHRAPTITDDA